MFCKWCGMESMTTDQCSWCHHSLTTIATEVPKSRAAEPETPEPVATSASFTEPEPESYHEESPLTAGLTAPKDQPKLATPLPATAHKETATRPIIGVRRPGTVGANGATGGRTIPAVPPPKPPVGTRMPPPAMPMPQRTPTQRLTPPVATANTATAPSSSTPTTRQSEVSPSKTGRLALPNTLMGGAKAAVPETVSAAPVAKPAPSARVGQPIVEGESGGLADGFSAPSRANENAHVPQMGTFTPEKSKYYSGQVIDPISGTHYDSDTGKPVTATSAETIGTKADNIVFNWDTPEQSMIQVLGKYLSVFGVILLVGAIFAAIAPGGMIAPLLIVNFVGGLLLPVMGVVQWQDEDSDHAVLCFVLSLFFGPVVALIIYAGLTAIWQSGNAAIVGVLGVGALSHIVIRLAARELPSFAALMPFQSTSLNVGLMFLNWTGLLALVGWFVANVFHKFDE